jgi:Ca-activated chloride channel family protein
VSFENPLLLSTLLVVPAALALYLLAERRRMRYAVRFTNLEVLARVVGGRPWRRYLPLALFLVALASLCVGLARPRVLRTVPDERATVILVLDASRSMQAQDVRPSRLAAAKAAARTFIDRFPERLRLGLIVFAGDVQVAAPPTTDHELVYRSVDAVENFAGFGGTAIGDAIARAVKLGQYATNRGGALASAGAASPVRSARRLVSIVFLSDGRQNRGILQPMEGAAIAKAAGIPVYTIALGTPNGGRIPGRSGGGGGPFGGGGGGGQGVFGGRRRAPDPETLKAIAQETGGGFFEARTASSLKTAYEELGLRLGRSPGRSELTFAFLLGGAAFLVMAGLLSARCAPRLP